MKKYRYLLIISLIIVCVLIAVRWTGLDDVITLENLKTHARNLSLFSQKYYIFSSIIFILIYIVVICVFIPGTSVLTLAGGFLYGPFIGALYSDVGATAGSILVFLFIRHFIGDKIHPKYTRKREAFNKELENKGYLYLLTLRFFPVIPYSIVNILSGMTKISLVTFMWTTSAGNFPGSLLLSFAGSEISRVKSMQDALKPQFVVILLLLTLISLSPIVITYIKKIKK